MKLRWLIMVAVLVVVSVILDLLLTGEHREYFPGFYALFGLIGASVLIILAWLTGRFLLERDEKYYRHDGDDD